MKEIPHPQINPYEQERKGTRWENYDYSRSGIYFLTLCAHHRKCYFGDMEEGRMKYSPQGSMAEVLLHLLPRFYPKVEMLNYVVMPDHIHVLMMVINDEADLRIFQQRNEEVDGWKMRHQKETISSIMGNYKSSLTRHCHRQGLEMEWQRGFFDRVVRNAEEQQRIDKYITDNPINWEIERNLTDGGWPV